MPLLDMMEKQTRRTLVKWALSCAPRFLAVFEQYRPLDERPREALRTAEAWSRGDIKMPQARKAILAAHAAAREADAYPAAQAAARAVCHAASSVHVKTHAKGLVFYGLTALVYEHKPADMDAFAAKECKGFLEQLLRQESAGDPPDRKWAAFLMKE